MISYRDTLKEHGILDSQVKHGDQFCGRPVAEIKFYLGMGAFDVYLDPERDIFRPVYLRPTPIPKVPS